MLQNPVNTFGRAQLLGVHESDNEEKLLLKKHNDRIEPHRVIALDILGRICSDDDAALESYKLAGRFGSAEALLRLKRIKF